MKVATLLALAAPLGANAHYIFNRLLVNDQAIGGDYAYTRKNTNSYMPSFTADIVNSNDLRCNKGAVAGSTATYNVKAGDKLGFKLFFNELIEHPGPGFVYISKAPGAVKNYDGSGDWVKVMQSGLKNPSAPGVDTNWESWQKDRLEWKIPTTLPGGEYLVRVEHIGLHEAHVGKAQFYMECFQLKIESSGTGTPGPTVKIPGVYKSTDAGIAFNKWSNPKSYTFPGPAVWSGGASAAAAASPATPVAAAKPATSAKPATPAPATPAAPVEEEDESCE